MPRYWQLLQGRFAGAPERSRDEEEEVTFSPAANRNKVPLLEVLTRVLPEPTQRVRPPLLLNVLAPRWPDALGRFDALYCANLLHIAEWATCAALMRGAARHVAPGGALVLYGPYLVDGEPTAPGNIAFDADLRRRNPAWGVRRLADVSAEAERAGMALEQRVDMPANNLLLVFRRPLD